MNFLHNNAKLTSFIIEYIKDNNLQQGDVLPAERKLSKILNTSRNSLREALRKLEACNIIEIRPGSGCYLKTTNFEIFFEENSNSLKTAMQLLEARLAVEPDILQLAIERITEKEITSLKNIVVKLSKSILERKIEKISYYDNEFKITLAKASHNKFLLIMLHQIENSNSILWECLKELPEEELNKIFGSYVKILNCIKKHDTTGAKQELRNQITLIFSYIREKSYANSESYTEEVHYD
ncbi:MAG TPA: GntR family transcriptional regulator [Spirochaetota bacterium]|jgi:DNA-binding FadR family transcriptional regulator|nr:GntR family transcriptional regulator [Spirochaetota bacterium]